MNNGVCHSLETGFKCRCLSESYSGVFCEKEPTSIRIRRFVSRGIAWVCFTAIATVFAFVIIMDIVKYCLGIDPVEFEREILFEERIRKEKERKRRQKYRCFCCWLVFINIQRTKKKLFPPITNSFFSHLIHVHAFILIRIIQTFNSFTFVQENIHNKAFVFVAFSVLIIKQFLSREKLKRNSLIWIRMIIHHRRKYLKKKTGL